jgi:hypothetical protein
MQARPATKREQRATNGRNAYTSTGIGCPGGAAKIVGRQAMKGSAIRIALD